MALCLPNGGSPMALSLEKVSRWELAAGIGIQSDFADGPATG